jgi:hypothetical protein
MWTSRNRARYDRSKLRYPSDVTDEEWELIVPLIPPRVRERLDRRSAPVQHLRSLNSLQRNARCIA